jgi:hypothetical protein
MIMKALAVTALIVVAGAAERAGTRHAARAPLAAQWTRVSRKMPPDPPTPDDPKKPKPKRDGEEEGFRPAGGELGS